MSHYYLAAPAAPTSVRLLAPNTVTPRSAPLAISTRSLRPHSLSMAAKSSSSDNPDTVTHRGLIRTIGKMGDRCDNDDNDEEVGSIESIIDKIIDNVDKGAKKIVHWIFGDVSIDKVDDIIRADVSGNPNTMPIPLVTLEEFKSIYGDIRPGTIIPYDVQVVIFVDVPIFGRIKIPLKKSVRSSVSSVPCKPDVDIEKVDGMTKIKKDDDDEDEE